MAAPPVPTREPPRAPRGRATPEPRVPISDEVTDARPAIPTPPRPARAEAAPTRGATASPPPSAAGAAIGGTREERAREPLAPTGSPAAREARPPINPFLSRDPRQKARRLARALVSDMIVYQPEKRQRALAAGTLKDAFAEEIKKSWEEYVDQVGKELADSTDYFTEALNEILAGGQRIF